MTIRESFSNTIYLPVTNQNDKGAVVQFQQCLDTFTLLLLRAYSETELFRNLSDYIFGVRNYENTKSMRVIFFFQNVWNLI